MCYRGIDIFDPEMLGKEFNESNVISATLDSNTEFLDMEHFYTILLKPGNKVIPLYSYYSPDFEILISTDYAKFLCSYSSGVGGEGSESKCIVERKYR